jgi:PPP family 3-phenylpropionic acid transporter
MSVRSAIKSHYFFYFFSIGIILPYLAPYYKELVGATDEQIGFLLMVPPLVAMVAQPFWSYFADLWGHRSRMAAVLAFCSAVVFLGIGQIENFMLLIVVLMLWAFFWTPMVSLVDSVTFHYLGPERRNEYSRLRIFGTLGFTVAAIFLGMLFDRYGLSHMFPLFAVSIMVSGLFIARAPSTEKSTHAHTRRALGVFLRQNNVRWFVMTGILAAVANQMALGFMSIYARDLGAQNTHLGWLWGVGTIAEAAMMPFVGRLITRIGIKRLLLYGMVLSLVRWGGMAMVPSWPALFPLQTLHAFTFTFIYVGSVTFMDVTSPTKIRSSAQALFGVLVMNGGRILAAPLSGEIAHLFGYRVLYGISASLVVVALVLLVFRVREPEQIQEGGPTSAV